ncbi:mitochondrial hypoxia responsive domain protein [Talaromyces stipitatus ATCC 10500]|uniref:Respiratory supercomplex factor 1, mitochondrial n=1 Tax=Talaromyces stipitatus (strain ATCC 10500 / CBS 375.48 / QM 6759 / NRRL 1006) TaxID=441959 RepID=RCF1_TALSN|nr:mitochondrial hypoxia responsive domain protein [Talaromyces stipitatus ATCC 10500]B8MJJ2.1 RecName: Full=Respiratory supercomplex factor 1, mitochondrial [Talaromyces stipitatus ATCC 10500]EED15192.1 mitochondrial hypoxia responsive domain protein [Talaromyces stipitatus ATCC 10500]
MADQADLLESPQFEEETSMQKFKRRLKEEPLIPLGCAATCYALYRAYRSGKAKDSVEMNRMFRARIYAQFFTLLAVVAGGMYYKTERKQRREFERKVEERKAQEKRDAWLRELEAREKEDKGWRERHAAVSEAANNPVGVSAVVAGKKEEEEKGVDGNVNQAPQEEGGVKRGTGILDAVKALVRGKKD